MADGTAIQINPEPKVYEKIQALSKRLGTSRAGFCKLAVEFVIPKVQSGELISVNGKLVPPVEVATVTA